MPYLVLLRRLEPELASSKADRQQFDHHGDCCAFMPAERQLGAGQSSLGIGGRVALGVDGPPFGNIVPVAQMDLDFHLQGFDPK